MARHAWLLMLAGCHVVFGLDDDIQPIEPPDTDGDGVLDADDVCITVPDPDQLDGDDDGLGNACDPCPADPASGDEHDEDGEGISDRCDNCPHVANRTQDNGDGDELGDACDLDTTAQCIAYFDPFEELPTTSFFTFGQWSTENGRLVQVNAHANHELLVIDGNFILPTVEVSGQVRTLPSLLPSEPSVVAVFAGITSASQGIALGVTTRLTQSDSNPQPFVQIIRAISNIDFETPPIDAIAEPNALRTIDAPFVIRQTLVTAGTVVATGTLGGFTVVNDPETVTGLPPGAIGIHTYNLGVAFDYLLVTVPCP